MRHPRCCTTRAPLWYVRTTAVKDAPGGNERVDWHPDHISTVARQLARETSTGRSRERSGDAAADLRCSCDAATAIGSRSPTRLAGRRISRTSSHRPQIDESPSHVGVRREPTEVPEVIDTWYDSGAMPFAQWGYHPDWAERGALPTRFRGLIPSDRSDPWLVLHVDVGRVLHFDSTAYPPVVCFGFIVDEQGRNMSKSLRATSWIRWR